MQTLNKHYTFYLNSLEPCRKLFFFLSVSELCRNSLSVKSRHYIAFYIKLHFWNFGEIFNMLHVELIMGCQMPLNFLMESGKKESLLSNMFCWKVNLTTFVYLDVKLPVRIRQVIAKPLVSCLVLFPSCHYPK